MAIMRERPIIFSAPMVRAILDGRKTQTRRIINPQPPDGISDVEAGTFTKAGREVFGAFSVLDPFEACCLYGRPGDHLWVREAFRGNRAYEVRGYAPKDWGNKPIWYEADGQPPGNPEKWAERARPSIHLPRWASRLTLEVTDVRAERLQAITTDDALAEGVILSTLRDPVVEFRWLWEGIHGDDSWEANPWVWVVEFQRIEAKEPAR